MPITFACTCGKKYSVPDELAGKKSKCKQCGAPISIPGGAKRSTSVVKAPPKAPLAPKPPNDIDFADTGPVKPKDDEMFQGPPPESASPEAKAVGGTANILYGGDSGAAARGAAAKKQEAKGNLVMWAVIGGVILVLLLVAKFVLIK